MIYLDNKTLLQELYIPRQEYISVTTGSSGTYAEGYADGYESGYTSGSTDGFDSGYTEGYTSGETHQKGLLSSTAFTKNGEYEREDGWSAITVSVSGSVLEGKEIVVSEDITVVTPDSGYDGFSAVTVDATEYGQTNYDSGFDDGYTDGYSSGASEGYDSGYTEGYQSGSTDGYESGYTSGETHQKSLLGTTAFTINGSYSAENGYSAITVNVPTGETYNIEQNKPFTATSNGDYTITPSSGITTVTDRFDSDLDRYYLSATTSGYPSVGIYNLFYIEDEFDSSKGRIDVYIENGYLDYDDSDWYGGEIVDLSVSREIDLFIRNANRHFEWYPLEDFDYHYDAMSAVTLNVNVPQTGHTDQELQDAYDSGYTSGENNVISTFSSITITQNGQYGSSAHPMSSITVNVPSSSGGSEDFAKLIDRSITEAVIPSGITKIGSYAFTYCYSLSSVTIPNTVTEIGNNAFMRNIFSAITIPSGVTKIGDYAFQYCSSLSSVTIPNSVTSIGSNAFASCYSLSSVTIPNSVTKIENYVFQYCSKLQSVTIPNSVTSIGSSSFDGCSVLIEANIGSGVTIINKRAFRSCSALTNIYISATTAPTISNANAFQGVPSTGTVHYPQGSDYSSWQSNTYLSGWTFSADL